MNINVNSEFQKPNFSDENIVYNNRYYLLTRDGEEMRSIVTFFSGSAAQIIEYEKNLKENLHFLRISREVCSVYLISEFGHVTFIKNTFEEDKKE